MKTAVIFGVKLISKNWIYVCYSACMILAENEFSIINFCICHQKVSLNVSFLTVGYSLDAADSAFECILDVRFLKA